MKIGILTGGGDVPGLNPCIKAVVYRAIDAGWEVVGIRRGWGGLLNLNPDDERGQREWVQPLTKLDVRTVDRYGGTHLHTSRTNPSKVREKEMPEFLKAQYPFEEGQPSVDFVHALRTPAGSHERIAIIELFGRNSGETALITSYLADADRCVISEVPFDVEKLAKFLVEDRRRNPSNYAICVISEGATILALASSLPIGSRKSPASTPSISRLPTSCALARPIRSTGWWPSPMPTLPSTW